MIGECICEGTSKWITPLPTAPHFMEPGLSTDWLAVRWVWSTSAMASHAYSLTSGASPRRRWDKNSGKAVSFLFSVSYFQACFVEIQLEAPLQLMYKNFHGACFSGFNSAHILCSSFFSFPSDVGINTLWFGPPGPPSAVTVQGLSTCRRWEPVLG